MTAPTGRRRARRAVWVVAGLAVALGGGLALIAPGHAAPAAEDTAPTRSTDTVTRQTLQQRQAHDGALGYGRESTLGTAAGGTVTWLPEVGAVLDRGQQVARVDDRPVVLLHGGMPLYRALEPGLRGPDVRQLKDNLAALGYQVTGDDRYTAGTAAAVRAWQRDLGRERTGTVQPGDVVVVPGPVRVAGHEAALGGTLPGDLVRATGTEHVVTAALAASERDRVAVGGSVELGLPGGRSTTGTVTAVSAPETPPADEEDPAASPGEPEVTVTVRVDDPAALDGLEHGPVEVRVVSGERTDVLTVPVVALLALAEGGYGVEVVGADGGTRLVPVTLGMFSAGRVEVAPEGGATLAEGDTVVVPS